MKKKIIIIMIIFILMCALIFFDKIINSIINIQWYMGVGYLPVYFTQVTAVFKLMIPIFIICSSFIYLYYKLIRKNFIEPNHVNNKFYHNNIILMILNFIISFIFSFYISSKYWYEILQFQSSSKFNVKDPIFNIDISFYIFKLPLIESMYKILISFMVFIIILAVFTYIIFLARDRYFYGKNKINDISKFGYIKSSITKFAGKQLAVISAIIFLMISLGYTIKSWNLVYSSRGVFFGAGYTDYTISLTFFRIIIFISIISSIIIFFSILKSRIKPIIASIFLISVLVVLENITSYSVQNLFVKSNERVLENKYIKYNMDFTKKAFGLDKIKFKDYNIKDTLSQKDIDENMATINNIKLNSFRQSLEFYNQVQVYRYYYNFNDVDVDRYNINGKQTEVFISPREIEQKLLNGNAGTWQNKHLTYTHGYGVVMSKVNSVTNEGQPEFLIKDIPMDNESSISLNNPRIYFGEKTDDYAIVNTKLSEFDYPNNNGSSDNNYNYDGKAGLNANFINRILFAINKRNLNFIISNSINSNSKIIINRNIVDMAKKIAPFLTYDSDPYIVIYNNRLYWIIDAYTTSNRYPFSEPINNVNYIRNSVKVVIDAFNGDIDFYQVDKNDPIANSYNKIFKGLFKNINTMPQGLKEHFRYPEGLFNMQCNMLEKYHVTNPDVFYNGEDVWSVSENQKSINSEKSINEASYVIMKLPDESKEESILLEYFNMKNKENLVGILGARMDDKNYADLIMYNLPNQKTIYSPYLFKQRINQNPDISKEIALWNTQGSQVQFGDTSIIPINNSLLYVEPLYLRAQGKNSIPEVKRVILASGDNFIMASNMKDALNQLFNNVNNKNSIVQNNPSLLNNNSRLEEAKELYDKAMEAQKNGDWSKYGEYIKQLGDKLKNIQN